MSTSFCSSKVPDPRVFAAKYDHKGRQNRGTFLPSSSTHHNTPVPAGMMTTFPQQKLAQVRPGIRIPGDRIAKYGQKYISNNKRISLYRIPLWLYAAVIVKVKNKKCRGYDRRWPMAKA
jgi:hypothetical protein